MTDEVVVKDQWGQIIFDDVRNTLELKWLPSTRDATDDDVRETMKLFTARAGKRVPSLLKVDTTEFHHRWGEGMMEWRNAEIIPGCNRAGVKKFAFIADDGGRWCPQAPRRRAGRG